MTAPITIIIVDDHQVVLDSWKSFLEANPRFKVVACCRDSIVAMERNEKLLPDILLVDVKMGPMNGFELTKRLVEKHPAIKIIGISVSNQINYAQKMIDNGARGYLTKTSTLEEINHAILEVYNGKVYLCEEIKKLGIGN
jgi:two-component system, NarL family, invasion response regulator UvrY